MTVYSYVIDWEEMMNEPRLDLYPLDYDDANHAGTCEFTKTRHMRYFAYFVYIMTAFVYVTGNEEFFVTSSNRPFQFQTGESKYVSQFFPGANAASLSDDRDETDNCRQELHQQNNVDFAHEYDQCQQQQLGELRHTRDRLKLNLVSSNGTPSAPFVPARQLHTDNEQLNVKENYESELVEKVVTQDQCIVSSPINDANALPKVPHEDVQVGPSSTRISQCNSQETLEPTEKCSVLARD